MIRLSLRIVPVHTRQKLPGTISQIRKLEVFMSVFEHSSKELISNVKFLT